MFGIATLLERSKPAKDKESGSIPQGMEKVEEASNSQMVTFEDYDDNEYEMEDEKVLELFRRNSGLRPEVVERNNNLPSMDKSEEMVLQFQEDTQQTVFHSLNDVNEITDHNSQEMLEGIKSSSASDEETDEDSSSNSDLDSNLSRYYFDGSLPVSTRAEESEPHQDEYHVLNDETKMPLLCPKQPLMQQTSWRNCCGLLELLRAADP